jgi:hypothetical protein
MLDFVNCEESENPSRVHSTVKEAGFDHGTSDSSTATYYAVTKAAWNFKRGSQVFENYGQPNHIYFTYHGFILPSNTHDCVYMELTMTEEERNALDINYVASIASVRPPIIVHLHKLNWKLCRNII